MEGQLKEAQDKLQQAQQNADLVGKQRGDLEVQLKEAQDKLQQAQQNADLVGKQRGDLEGQLKEAQDKLQQARQQNADLTPSQRAVLEARLKKAEEKLQLAQQAQQLRIWLPRSASSWRLSSSKFRTSSNRPSRRQTWLLTNAPAWKPKGGGSSRPSRTPDLATQQRDI